VIKAGWRRYQIQGEGSRSGHRRKRKRSRMSRPMMASKPKALTGVHKTHFGHYQ